MKHPLRRLVVNILTVTGVLFVSNPGLALDTDCRSLDPVPPGGDYGLDYRDQSPKNREFMKLVEDYHFTPPVEQLISGATGSILGDLSYVLRRYPNHHRALFAMIRYHRTHPQEFVSPPECYLRRAIEIYPRDAILRMLFGIYLHNNDYLQQALEQYQVALGLYDRSAELHYNVGLLYVDLEDFTKAREHAKRAYALGYQLPGLRRKLEAVNQWR